MPSLRVTITFLSIGYADKQGRESFSAFGSLVVMFDADKTKAQKPQTNLFRYISWEDSADLLKDSNPFLGAGIGGYRHFQIEKRGEFIEILDSTPLWLLVELGILGSTCFFAFLMFCLYRFYMSGWRDNSSPFHRAMFVFLIMFCAVSVLHEILYTRFLWFFVGFSFVSSKSIGDKRL